MNFEGKRQEIKKHISQWEKIAEWIERLLLELYTRLWFRVWSIQSLFKLVFNRLPAWRFPLNGQREKQAGKFTCAVVKDT